MLAVIVATWWIIHAACGGGGGAALFRPCRQELDKHKPKFREICDDMKDFYMEIAWDLHTWVCSFSFTLSCLLALLVLCVSHELTRFTPRCLAPATVTGALQVPLVSRALPHDTLRIWKQGRRIRVDSDLIDIADGSMKKQQALSRIIEIPQSSDGW